MPHKGISVNLALRFTEGAFKRRDYARALFWVDVAKQTIERNERNNTSPPKTERAIARANAAREAKR